MTNYVNSVQQVSITIASGATTGTASITAATGTYFVVFQGNTTTATTTNSQAFARVSISGTTVTATRGASSANTCTVNCAIVDADATNLIKSVQMGTISLTSQASNTATITSVTAANAAVHMLGFTTTGTGYHYDLDSPVLVLTNATTVTCSILQGADTNTEVVGYLVVEFQSTALHQSKQAFAKTFTNSTGSSTQAITSVNVNNSMIFFAGSGAGNGDLAADEQCIATLTSATVVTVSCGNTSSGNVVQCNFTVIEFVAGVLSQNAQRGTIAVAAATSNTATITSAATANTLLNMVGWKSTSTVTTSHAQIRPRVTQTSATVVTANVNTSANGTTTVEYEALTFSTGGSTLIPTALTEFPDGQLQHIQMNEYEGFDYDFGIVTNEIITLDKWNNQAAYRFAIKPPQQAPIPVHTVPLANAPVAPPLSWEPTFWDGKQYKALPKLGDFHYDFGIFTKENITLDKWAHSFIDSIIKAPRVVQEGYFSYNFGIATNETITIDKWKAQYPDMLVRKARNIFTGHEVSVLVFRAGGILPFPWMWTTGNMQDMTGGMRM